MVFETEKLEALVSEPPQEEGIDRRRYLRITTFFASVILSVIGNDLILGRVPLLKARVKNGRSERFRMFARRFRDLAADMGGVMIKLGQFLSARVDVLPPEIILELIGLQDEVPPVDLAEIEGVLTAEFGDIDQRFQTFDKEPLAAASLGQTHRATMVTAEGVRDVVVKVQRPDIESIVRTDLSALRTVAKWVMAYEPIRRRADVPALMEEFAVTLWEELDYRLEVENAERFRGMFAEYDGLVVPEFYEEACTGRVLVIENVSNLKITDTQELSEAGVDLGALADRLLDVYYRQVFDEAFFHADPHPGNLFVRPRPDLVTETTASTPFDLIFIDFGMMGRIPEGTLEILSRVLISMVTQNAAGLTQAFDELGFFLPGADLERISEAQSKVLEQIWGRGLVDLANPDMAEVKELGNEFKDILFAFPFQVPQNFVYLGRALGILSGLSVSLNPTIDPFTYIEKYGQKLLRRQQADLFNSDSLLNWLREMATLPVRVKRVVDSAESGTLRLNVKPDKQTSLRLDKLEKRSRQLNSTITSAALLTCGTILYVNSSPDLAVGFWVMSGILFLWSRR